MGWFKSLFDMIKNMINSILKSIRSFLKSLGPLLPLLIIAAFIFAPMIAGFLANSGWLTLATVFAEIGTYTLAMGPLLTMAVGLGVSAIVFPDQTAELIDRVGNAVGELASAAVGVVKTGLSALFDGAGWIILGIGAFLLLRDEGTARSGPSVQGGEGAY